MATQQNICRISSLKGFNGVLYGRDLAGIFKPGHVYEVVELMGTIMLTDIGEHAVPEWLGTRGTINQYATSGVVMLTKKEYKAQEIKEIGE